MAKTRTVVKPGYHIKPKYDLHNLRLSRTKGVKGFEVPELPLVSLIDMFTILVIFLLMNFSATGEVFFIQKNLKMPEALHANPIASAPLVSITKAGVSLDLETGSRVSKFENENTPNYPRLVEALRALKQEVQNKKPNEVFKGFINIQADETMELVYIKRVMQICIQEGWIGINFAVRQIEK